MLTTTLLIVALSGSVDTARPGSHGNIAMKIDPVTYNVPYDSMTLHFHRRKPTFEIYSSSDTLVSDVAVRQGTNLAPVDLAIDYAAQTYLAIFHKAKIKVYVNLHTPGRTKCIAFRLNGDEAGGWTETALYPPK